MSGLVKLFVQAVERVDVGMSALTDMFEALFMYMSISRFFAED